MANDSILARWNLTLEELTEAVDSNPSLRGMLFGYVAETVLKKMWFSTEHITHAVKYDDHDRKRKGDLVVTYKGESFIVESKSLQTNMIKKVGQVWTGKAQCDASDRRTIELPDGSKITTTCLLPGEFDLLAVNCFAFENKWRFVFAKNSELPRSKYAKYTSKQRESLLASLIPISWPPEPPFHAAPYPLLDQILAERKATKGKLMILKDAQQIKVTD
ncbi:MAG TPA: hypothetical protein VJ875_06035 [Pyrinomonadaceae bacterium]|nr:hypothetical protein [Pyrinomonadaceae bacterium]